MTHFKSIISRLTGISTPIFGVSWHPPDLEQTVARELLAYLEDRRYLFSPFEQEQCNYVIQSTVETRDRLSEFLPRANRESPLGEGIIAMRSASREFMNKIDAGTRIPSLGFELILALGELRSIYGLHIARIAVAYAIDISEDLSRILPPAKSRMDTE